MGKRQRRREREKPPVQETAAPESQDVTVTAGVATASGIVTPDKNSED